MSCVLAENAVGYAVALAGPTLLFVGVLYLAATATEPPLTVTQRETLALLGVESASTQRAIAALFCGLGLAAVLPIHYLLLADCL